MWMAEKDIIKVEERPEVPTAATTLAQNLKRGGDWPVQPKWTSKWCSLYLQRTSGMTPPKLTENLGR